MSLLKIFPCRSGSSASSSCEKRNGRKNSITQKLQKCQAVPFISARLAAKGAAAVVDKLLALAYADSAGRLQLWIFSEKHLCCKIMTENQSVQVDFHKNKCKKRAEMAVFRCNECAYLQEVPAKHVGKAAKCPRCQQEGAIYDTIALIEKILEKYLMQAKVLRELQEQLQPHELENRIESARN